MLHALNFMMNSEYYRLYTEVSLHKSGVCFFMWVSSIKKSKRIGRKAKRQSVNMKAALYNITLRAGH